MHGLGCFFGGLALLFVTSIAIGFTDSKFGGHMRQNKALMLWQTFLMFLICLGMAGMALGSILMMFGI